MLKNLEPITSSSVRLEALTKKAPPSERDIEFMNYELSISVL